jgi:riboflavin synthase
LGGHLVSGHVDAVARVVERQPLGDFVLFTFAVPPGLDRYIIAKGSITIDGISLTVNRCDERSFAVSIIPHTLAVTTLGGLSAGALVNLEVDLIGKYVEKLLSVKPEGGVGAASALNPAFLAEHGFIK